MDLVGNLKADRFSRGVATALKITQYASVYSFLTFVTEISSRFSIFKILNSNWVVLSKLLR